MKEPLESAEFDSGKQARIRKGKKTKIYFEYIATRDKSTWET